MKTRVSDRGKMGKRPDRRRAGGLRVTGGELCGRRLRVPATGARPTAEPVREALFARLGDLGGVRVLDLYAGSGALGIEALSRGAGFACFVERSPRALAALRANLEQLALGGRAALRPGEVLRVLRRLGQEALCFDLVLLDPPYAGDEAPRALQALGETGLLAPGATLVLERSRRHPVPRVEGFEVRDERRYGDTVITRFAPLGGGGPGPA